MRVRVGQSEVVAAAISSLLLLLVVLVAIAWVSKIHEVGTQVREEVEVAKERLLVIFDREGSKAIVINQWDHSSRINAVLYLLSNGSKVIKVLRNPIDIPIAAVATLNLSDIPQETKTVCVATWWLHIFCNITIPEGQNSTTIVLPGSSPELALFIKPEPTYVHTFMELWATTKVAYGKSQYSSEAYSWVLKVPTAIIYSNITNTSALNITEAAPTIVVGQTNVTWFRLSTVNYRAYIYPEGEAVEGLPVVIAYACYSTSGDPVSGGYLVRFTDSYGSVRLPGPAEVCGSTLYSVRWVVAFEGTYVPVAYTGTEVIINLTKNYAAVIASATWEDTNGNVVVDGVTYNLPTSVVASLWATTYSVSNLPTWSSSVITAPDGASFDGYLILNASVNTTDNSLTVKLVPARWYTVRFPYTSNPSLTLDVDTPSPIMLNYGSSTYFVEGKAYIASAAPSIPTSLTTALITYHYDYGSGKWVMDSTDTITLKLLGTHNSSLIYGTTKALLPVKAPANDSITTYVVSEFEDFINYRLDPESWPPKAYCLYGSEPYPLGCDSFVPVFTVTRDTSPVSGSLIDYSGINEVINATMVWNNVGEVLNHNNTWWLSNHVIDFSTNMTAKYLVLLDLNTSINTTADILHRAEWYITYYEGSTPPPPPSNTEPFEPEPNPVNLVFWFTFAEEERKVYVCLLYTSPSPRD